jgi:hypothetical protein
MKALLIGATFRSGEPIKQRKALTLERIRQPAFDHRDVSTLDLGRNHVLTHDLRRIGGVIAIE